MTYWKLLLLFGLSFCYTSMLHGQNDLAKPRFFALSYTQRILLTSFNEFSNKQASNLPELNNNARFHGMSLKGAVSKSLIVGLYAQGSLNDAENSVGYSNWGGGLGAVTFQYNYSPLKNFIIYPGFGLGCGRFNYSSAEHDGTNAQSIYSDAIYIEPCINIGYSFWNKLLIMIEGSYMQSLSGNEYQTAKQNLPSAFPKGLFFGLSIGYKSPFYKW